MSSQNTLTGLTQKISGNESMMQNIINSITTGNGPVIIGIIIGIIVLAVAGYFIWQNFYTWIVG